LILGRKKRNRHRPLNADRRIVPQETAFVLGNVKVRAFIGKSSDLAEHAKPMGKPWRDIELSLVFRREFHAEPLSKRRRTGPDIHGHIKHDALDGRH
jgi:hypothetical protein